MRWPMPAKSMRIPPPGVGASASGLHDAGFVAVSGRNGDGSLAESTAR